MEDEMERILEEMDKYNLTDHATINKQKNVILSQLLEKILISHEVWLQI
jgi:hypothetical protein